MAADTAEKKVKKKDWLEEHIKYVSALKAPSDTQKLLISLNLKSARTQAEERTFLAIVKSEKALERAKKAKAAVSSMLSKEKTEEAAKERKERTQKLIQLGLLFSYAGVDKEPRDFLAGLLLFGVQMQEKDRHQLTKFGAQLLSEKEKAPAKAPAPAPAPAPAKAPAPAPAPARSRSPAPAPAPAPATSSTRMYLLSDASDEDEVKALGGRWDADRAQWFAPPGVDLTRFKKWIRA